MKVDVYGRAVYLQSEKYNNFHLKWLLIFLLSVNPNNKTCCLYHGLHCLYDQSQFLDMNKQLLTMCNIGITHFFHALTFPKEGV